MTFDPVDLVAPARQMIPPLTPLRAAASAFARPRYVPGPLAEGMVRVVLTSAGCENEPAEVDPYDPDRWSAHKTIDPSRVFDIPAETFERWQAAAAAFDAMQEEIDATISARQRRQ